MSIKNTYSNVEDIPEGMESVYTKNEDTGVYHLPEVEGFVAKDRLDEFRDNNVGLRQEIEGQVAKLSEMQKTIDGFQHKESKTSVDDNDNHWQEKWDAQGAKHSDEISLLQKQVYGYEVDGVIGEYSGKNVLPTGQAHFNEIVKGKVTKGDDGTYMVGDIGLNKFLDGVSDNPEFAIFMPQPESTGAGSRNDSLGNVSVTKDQVTGSAAIAAGLASLDR